MKLLESFRDDTGQPRHRTVVSLGDAPIKKDDWKLIAKALEDILYGHQELVKRDLSENQRGWVDRIIRRIGSEGHWESPKNKESGPVIDGVLADKVTHTETAQLGAELIGWETWKRLGMPQLLDTLGFNHSQSQAASISVINRLVDPVHEHNLIDWYRRTGLPELMGSRLRGAGDDRFYRVSDLLLKHQHAIEKHLREQQSTLFNLNRTVLLYDLTNTHFEGLCNANPKAERGKNKQKRNDCMQIVVGMVFDEFGFEMSHKIFEGSLNDSKSLVDMIDQLDAVYTDSHKKPLIVMDAGIASKKNRQLLRNNGYSYLVNDTRNQRGNYLKEFKEDDKFKTVPGRENKSPVQVRLLNEKLQTDSGDASERVVLCKSYKRGSKEKAIMSNAEKRFCEDVEKLVRRIEKKQLKNRDKIHQAIGRIKTRHTRVQRYYTITFEEVDGGHQLRYQRKEEACSDAETLHGCYVLRTDEQTLSETELWQLYISLTKAEEGFKMLKSHLGLRPNPHQKEDRVDAHVFICVIAYHLLCNIQFMLEQQEDRRNWDTIKRILKTHCYTTIQLPTQNGDIHRIRRAGEPEECQKTIYNALQIDWRRLPVNRFDASASPATATKDQSQTTL